MEYGRIGRTGGDVAGEFYAGISTKNRHGAGQIFNQLRLQEAALLLNKTQKSVLSVALDVGYQSEAHFSKAFKALYGVSPSQYRKAEQV